MGEWESVSLLWLSGPCLCDKRGKEWRLGSVALIWVGCQNKTCIPSDVLIQVFYLLNSCQRRERWVFVGQQHSQHSVSKFQSDCPFLLQCSHESVGKSEHTGGPGLHHCSICNVAVHVESTKCWGSGHSKSQDIVKTWYWKAWEILKELCKINDRYLKSMWKLLIKCKSLNESINQSLLRSLPNP